MVDLVNLTECRIAGSSQTFTSERKLLGTGVLVHEVMTAMYTRR